uniref:Uncharacterized protein n=1 Tax=Human herpesvirus 2 TaxID=10310 RepID=A0A481TSD5_HHV2|nr:hypothetical protein [Human alphaherpesvirus 2]
MDLRARRPQPQSTRLARGTRAWGCLMEGRGAGRRMPAGA